MHVPRLARLEPFLYPKGQEKTVCEATISCYSNDVVHCDGAGLMAKNPSLEKAASVQRRISAVLCFGESGTIASVYEKRLITTTESKVSAYGVARLQGAICFFYQQTPHSYI